MNQTMKRYLWRYIFMLTIVMITIVIFNFSAQEGEESSSISGRVARIIVDIRYGENMPEEQKKEKVEQLQPYVRKMAHFSIYTLLGICIMSCAKTYQINNKKAFIISLILGIAYAGTDEFHQLFVPGRSGRIFDIGIDSFGILVGITIVVLIYNIIKDRKKKGKRKKDIDKKKKVLFIASTGGHLNELMQLKSIFHEYDYEIVTEKTKIDGELKETYQKKIHYLLYGTKKTPIRYAFILLINCFISLYLFFKTAPEVIVTTGTHTAVLMCYIAKLFGSKVIFIETFANRTTKTMAGKMVYPIADTFVVQWDEMMRLYPKAVCWGWIY